MDEARFGTHSKIGHGWFVTGKRSRVKVKLGFKNFYVYSAVEPATGENVSLILPKVDTQGMNMFLKELGALYPNEPMALVMDGAGWHKSKGLEVPEGIELVHLPPYSPELNPVERLWLHLKKIVLRNKIYPTLDLLKDTVCDALNALKQSTVQSICTTKWLS